MSVPPRWRGDVTEAIESRRQWVEEALARVADRRSAYLSGPEALLPHAIMLAGDTYSVSYESAVRPRFRCSERELLVFGQDAESRLSALGRWLDAESKNRLSHRLAEIAEFVGVRPEAVTVRRVRSRWGSCSSRGRISLNRNLVFLPQHLVDSVIYHELAHLSQLNHSPAFYSVLERFNPAWRTHRAELRDAGRVHVPVWADA